MTPRTGRSHGGGNGNPLQYSCLENCLGYGPWGCKESDTAERLTLSLLRYQPSGVHMPMLSLKLPFSTWVGPLVLIELRDMYQIVYI